MKRDLPFEVRVEHRLTRLEVLMVLVVAGEVGNLVATFLRS